MKLNSSTALIVAGAALAAVVILWPKKSVPATAANRGAQLRADAFRSTLWARELAGQPDFYM
jgi:hypothetical protein